MQNFPTFDQIDNFLMDFINNAPKQAVDTGLSLPEYQTHIHDTPRGRLISHTKRTPSGLSTEIYTPEQAKLQADSLLEAVKKVTQ